MKELLLVFSISCRVLGPTAYTTASAQMLRPTHLASAVFVTSGVRVSRRGQKRATDEVHTHGQRRKLLACAEGEISAT